MEENKEKELDVFFSKAIKEVGMESPSLDFTKKLFAKIETKQVKKAAFVYEPIISRFTWIILAVIVLSVFSYGLFGNYHSEMNWWPVFDLDILASTIKFPEISISKTYVYSFVGLAVFLGLQVYFIKQYHNKRFSLEA